MFCPYLRMTFDPLVTVSAICDVDVRLAMSRRNSLEKLLFFQIGIYCSTRRQMMDQWSEKSNKNRKKKEKKERRTPFALLIVEYSWPNCDSFLYSMMYSIRVCRRVELKGRKKD